MNDSKKIVVEKNKTNTYKLKLTALSPIHIGTGEVYEPTNFIIDDGYLYEFDEYLFLKILPKNQRQEFVKHVSMKSDKGYEYFEKIHAFILKHKEYAKKVSIKKVKVSQELESKYKNDIGKKVQTENRNNNTNSVFNKFEIQKTLRNVNTSSTYIAGSSLKGAISTAYQEMLYKQGGDKVLKKFHDDKVFRNISISDTLVQDSSSQIAFSINKELFEEDDSEISTMIEVNSKNSEYLATLDLKSFLNDDCEIIFENVTKEKIIKACNSHYKMIYGDKECQEIKLGPNQFLLSVGKHSGARAVTIDGLRKISVKLCQIQNKRDEGDDAEERIKRLHKKSYFEDIKIKNLFAEEKLLDEKEKNNFINALNFIENPSKLEQKVQENKKFTITAILNQETTVWEFSENKSSGENFGWLLCEFIDDIEYEKLYEKYDKLEKECAKNLHESKNSVISQLKIEKDMQEKEKLKKKQEKEAQIKLELEEKQKEQERLQSLSPYELLKEELQGREPNTPLDTILFIAIRDGKLDEFKKDALSELVNIMKKEGKWVETSNAKNKAKDKNHQRTMQVKKMID